MNQSTRFTEAYNEEVYEEFEVRDEKLNKEFKSFLNNNNSRSESIVSDNS